MRSYLSSAVVFAIFSSLVACTNSAENTSAASSNVEASALDSTFGTAGEATLTDDAYRAPWGWARQPDGKIVVASSLTFSSEFSFNETFLAATPDLVPSAGAGIIELTRIDADGQLDASFGEGGKVALRLPQEVCPRTVAFGAGGQILVSANTVEGSRWRTGVYRFEANGAPAGNVVTIDDGGATKATAPRVFAHDDGSFDLAWLDVTNQIQHFAADGSPAGAVADGGDGVTQAPDGRLVVLHLGETSGTATTLDGATLFGALPAHSRSLDGQPFAIHMNAQGDLSYLVQRLDGTTAQRLNAGTPSTAYVLHHDGTQTTIHSLALRQSSTMSTNEHDFELSDVVVDATGHVIVTGNEFIYGARLSTAKGFVSRFLPDGKVDTAFSTNGSASLGRSLGGLVDATDTRVLSLNWNQLRPVVTAFRTAE